MRRLRRCTVFLGQRQCLEHPLQVRHTPALHVLMHSMFSNVLGVLLVFPLNQTKEFDRSVVFFLVFTKRDLIIRLSGHLILTGVLYGDRL